VSLSLADGPLLTLWYLPCSPLHNRDLHNIADLKHVYESAFNRVGTERLRNMIRALSIPPCRRCTRTCALTCTLRKKLRSMRDQHASYCLRGEAC